MPPGDADRSLTAGALASLLARLSPDAERAGLAYEDLRRALVSFFTWRGAVTPEECADETLDRLAKRLEEGVAVEDVPRFARGVARLVLLEHWRRLDARRVSLQEVQSPALAAPDVRTEALSECLDRCLGELPAASRELVLEYYAADGRDRMDSRKRIARKLGVTESALRNRAQRVRDRLERCIILCMGLPAAGPRPGHDT